MITHRVKRLDRLGLAATMLAVVLATALPAASRADDSERIDLPAQALVAGAAIGVHSDGRSIQVSNDANLDQSGLRSAMAESATRLLRGPSQLNDVRLVADVPPGAAVELWLRGQRDGRWTEWREPHALDHLDGAMAVEVRTNLVVSPSGDTPVVHWIHLRAERANLRAAQVVTSSAAPTVKLWATRVGLVGRTTANGHVIGERDHFVALPSKRSLNRAGARDYQVQIAYRGRTTVAPVWDIGPWNTKDDYWNDEREGFDDLPRWMPQSEAAFFQNHNAGRDGMGRWVSIPTAIDIADGTFLDDLGMGDGDWVEVTFLWLSAPSPAPRATPRVMGARPTPAGATAATAPSPAPATLLGVASPSASSVAAPVFRAAAYNAPSAAQRVYLPLVKRNAEGWTTDWTVQNVANTAVEGIIDVYDGGGGREASLPFQLGPFASLAVSADEVPDLPVGFVGSAVVSASRPIAAVVTGDRLGSDRYAYEGITTGAATLFAPMILKERDGWSTGIQVQNLGAAATTVQLLYVGASGGRWIETVDLPANGSATVYQPANPALPPGFNGSAIISSGNGQQLAALVNQARGNGATMAYAAAAGGSERLEAPVLFKHYNGWDSAVQIFNLGSNSAPATITYYGAPQPIWDNAVVPAGSGMTVMQGTSGLLPDGFTGSATVLAPSGSRLTGIVSEVRAGTMAAMSYSAGATPDVTLAVPHLVRAADGWNSGLEVLNPNAVPVAVVLTLYDEAGTLVQRIQETINPGATRNFYLAAIDGVPDGFHGSAIVQSLSGHPLLAVVNEVGR